MKRERQEVIDVQRALHLVENHHLPSRRMPTNQLGGGMEENTDFDI
jgi:hypothetical protein